MTRMKFLAWSASVMVASAATARADVRGDGPSSLRMRPSGAARGIGAWWKRVAQAATDQPAPADPPAPDPAAPAGSAAPGAGADAAPAAAAGSAASDGAAASAGAAGASAAPAGAAGQAGQTPNLSDAELAKL